MTALTKREITAAEFAALGLTYKEAAREMHIAPDTVRRHWASLRDKLEARNMAHAVAILISRGLINIALCVLVFMQTGIVFHDTVLRRPPRPPAVRLVRGSRSRELHESAGIRV